MMINFLIGLVFGMLPEVIYFTTFIVNTKNIKEKKAILFILISLEYILLVMVSRFKTVYYLGFIFLTYLILKILYKKKTQIIDIFVFSISTIYLSLIGFVCSLPVNNNYAIYYFMYIVNRILLFTPFIFKRKFNILYKKYCSLWNRNYDKKQPIKSITLRNISLIILNSFIFLLNIATIYVINTFQ